MAKAAEFLADQPRLNITDRKLQGIDQCRDGLQTKNRSTHKTVAYGSMQHGGIGLILKMD